MARCSTIACSSHTLQCRPNVSASYLLHGAGERGDDNTAQLKHGMKEFCKPQWREKYPCYVLAPQCPEGKKWVEVDWSADSHDMPAEPSESMRLLFELADTMVKDSAVNKNRIVINRSIDGRLRHLGCTRASARFFCGGSSNLWWRRPQDGREVCESTCMVFSCDNDKAVPVKRSRDMI